VATDLAKALEIRRTADLADRLDPDQKGGGQISTLGGTQSLGVISESGFYDVVVRSDKPEGKQLRQRPDQVNALWMQRASSVTTGCIHHSRVNAR
jgi:hypothetical protein